MLVGLFLNKSNRAQKYNREIIMQIVRAGSSVILEKIQTQFPTDQVKFVFILTNAIECNIVVLLEWDVNSAGFL